ncbi:MAG: hypothetical protein ED558_17470 [Oricola sp.]|nr:MAG: hypothetical protein ED558_17470 [Oricola sp.]
MPFVPAITLTEPQLQELLVAAGRLAAEQVVAELRASLVQDPREQTLLRLRGFLQDPSTITDPRAQWADSALIRRIRPNRQGKPKSVAWFMKFQKATGLCNCPNRRSPNHGRAKEWTFADIRHAWQHYYQISR